MRTACSKFSSAVVVLRAVGTDFCAPRLPVLARLRSRHPMRAYRVGIFMRQKSCKLGLLGLAWLGHIVLAFLIALSALWVDIGVASAVPVREMIPNPEKKYSVVENAGKSLDPAGGTAIHVAAKKHVPAEKDEPGPPGPPGPQGAPGPQGPCWAAGACWTAGACGCSGNARPARSRWACGPR